MHASSRDDAAGKRTTPPVQPQITTFSDAFSLLQATHLWFPRMNDLLPFNDLRALRRVSRGLRDSMPRGHFNLLSLAYQFQQPCLKFAGFVYKEAGSTEAGVECGYGVAKEFGAQARVMVDGVFDPSNIQEDRLEAAIRKSQRSIDHIIAMRSCQIYDDTLKMGDGSADAILHRARSQRDGMGRCVEDIVGAFGRLRRSEFHTLGTRDMKNIIEALECTQSVWEATEDRLSLTVLLIFMKGLVRCANMLDIRADACIWNDAGRVERTYQERERWLKDVREDLESDRVNAQLPPQVLVARGQQGSLQSAPLFFSRGTSAESQPSSWSHLTLEGLIVDTEDVDWAALFPLPGPVPTSWMEERLDGLPPTPDFDYQEEFEDSLDFWLTPRLAAKLHWFALFTLDSCHHGTAEERAERFNEPDTDRQSLLFSLPISRLPRIARYFYKHSRVWRRDYYECFYRLALRLQKGLELKSMCTGEEAALHWLIRKSDIHLEQAEEEEDSSFWKFYGALPTHRRDDKMEEAEEMVIDSSVVYELYKEGDEGYNYESSEEDFDDVLPDVCVCREDRRHNPHPAKWFQFKYHLDYGFNGFNDHLTRFYTTNAGIIIVMRELAKRGRATTAADADVDLARMSTVLCRDTFRAVVGFL